CFKNEKAYQKYAEYTESQYNEFGRTKKSEFSTTKQPLIWTAGTQYSFSSMMECQDFLSDKKDDPRYAPLFKKYDFPKNQLSKIKKNLIRYVESTFKCSGICTSAFFYYSNDISMGMPEKTCIEEI
uniref:hypothetical protein n=1 Tax=Enterococcus rotai TaxID=118060 RepID=UPI0035C7275F